MNDLKLKISTVVAAVALPVGLILLGAGCFQAVKQTGSAVGRSQDASVEARQKTNELAAAEQAKQNERDEMASDDVTIAFILSGTVKPPADAVILPDVFGCSDRVALVKEHKAAATDSIVHDSLLTLFSLHDSGTHSPLYNALGSDSLQIDKIQSTDGVTTEVWLKGTVTPGGACDGPRIKAQIEGTVARFRPLYKIFLNGSEAAYRCLGDMTGKCI